MDLWTAAESLNHVRLPNGYCAFDVSAGEPYIQGQLPYLEKAVTWADNHGLKVIVDLHGAPASQNGFDNSGHRISFPQWQADQTNIQRTDAIIKTIANMFKGNTNVVPVIAPLNEPAGFDGEAVLEAVRQYWYDSYGNIRYPYGSSQESNTVVLLHDAFQPLSYWNGFMNLPGWQGVAMDTHIYQMFSDADVARTNAQHISAACQMEDSSQLGLWLIVGEWTPAMTDCAKYLNGRGIGARYDGTYSGSSYVGSCTGKTGSAASFSSDYKVFLRQSWEAQVSTYEKVAGWIMWTWKAENADDWSYQAGLAGGWIPQDPTERKYPAHVSPYAVRQANDLASLLPHPLLSLQVLIHRALSVFSPNAHAHLYILNTAATTFQNPDDSSSQATFNLMGELTLKGAMQYYAYVEERQKKCY
ncbi:glycoside hydrolase [Gymnopus androsaceus JB14]|uniref:Glycoside hydrolase n=1 Tax=Gymnopus androsaceus JB14 TaxID=1447944 RepID=A0A6A4GXV5_9AGAR|nr:glycoside hydrolase [Gymnopus androsaceus JB14]